MFSTKTCLGDMAARIAVQKTMLEFEAKYWLKKPLAERREYLASKKLDGRREALQAEMRRQHEATKKNEAKDKRD
jgi:hypothetical protein